MRLSLLHTVLYSHIEPHKEFYERMFLTGNTAYDIEILRENYIRYCLMYRELSDLIERCESIKISTEKHYAGTFQDFTEDEGIHFGDTYSKYLETQCEEGLYPRPINHMTEVLESYIQNIGTMLKLELKIEQFPEDIDLNTAVRNIEIEVMGENLRSDLNDIYHIYSKTGQYNKYMDIIR